jgi:hypothetical protein
MTEWGPQREVLTAVECVCAAPVALRSALPSCVVRVSDSQRKRELYRDTELARMDFCDEVRQDSTTSSHTQPQPQPQHDSTAALRFLSSLPPLWIAAASSQRLLA